MWSRDVVIPPCLSLSRSNGFTTLAYFDDLAVIAQDRVLYAGRANGRVFPLAVYRQTPPPFRINFATASIQDKK